jgi:chemotaxis protein histidine kinase CheA
VPSEWKAAEGSGDVPRDGADGRRHCGACTIAESAGIADDGPVSTLDDDRTDVRRGEAPTKRRNPWVWISAALAIVAAGMLIWALSTRSDLDSTERELDSTSQELNTTQQELDTTEQELTSSQQDAEELQSQSDEGNDRRGALAAAAVLYDEFSEQLDATNEDLAATQKDLKDAEKAASQAEKEAAAAKQDASDATDDTEKAKAQADQAKAEAKAAQSRAAIAADCAKGYISAFGGLFEGDSVRDQAPVVREELAGITAACKDQLAAP